MVKFKNYIYLCVFTTTVFSFMQSGVIGSANAEDDAEDDAEDRAPQLDKRRNVSYVNNSVPPRGMETFFSGICSRESCYISSIDNLRSGNNNLMQIENSNGSYYISFPPEQPHQRQSDNSDSEENAQNSQRVSFMYFIHDGENRKIRVDNYYDPNNGICAEFKHNPVSSNNQYIDEDLANGFVANYYYSHSSGRESSSYADKNFKPYMYVCDKCGTNNTIDNYFFSITSQNSDTIPADYIAVNVKVDKRGDNNHAGNADIKKIRADVKGINVKIISEVPEISSEALGVSVSQGGRISLTHFTAKNIGITLFADEGIIDLSNGDIEIKKEDSENGIFAVKAKGGKAVVTLTDVKIKTSNEEDNIFKARGGEENILNSNNGAEEECDCSENDSEVQRNDESIDLTNVDGVSQTINSDEEEENQKDRAAIFVQQNAFVDLKNGNINVTDFHGFMLSNSVKSENDLSLDERSDLIEDDWLNTDVGAKIYVKNSRISVQGKGSHGIHFLGSDPLEEQENEEDVEGEGKPLPKVSLVNIKDDTILFVEDVAIYGDALSHGVVSLVYSTISSENLLLKAQNGAFIKVLADASSIQGGTSVDNNSNAGIYLQNSSRWILPQRQRNNLHESDDKDVSSISFVSLKDSAIRFAKSKHHPFYDYQKLYIGNGEWGGSVYEAEGGAKIYFNTHLSAKGLHDNKQTDRVLINGDVSGKTVVYVNPVLENFKKDAKSKKDSKGISLIQVAGKAHQDSFMLHGDYVALDGSPYQYRLHAYHGLESGLKGEVGKRFVKGEGKFWNFYLKSAYVGRPGYPRPDEPGIRVVVPQVPTYLLLPNALFQSGLVDLNNQNKRLEIMRFAAARGPLKCNGISTIFLRGYGSNYQYTSNLSAFEYGYGGELDYNAVEAGVLLKTIDGAFSATSLGIIGTYGKVSLQPLDVEQSQKSVFDKWTVTAYGSTRYDNGLYVDGLVSYGLFQGDVSTLARGKTATLKGNPLNVSVTAGKALMTGSRDFVFDPQVQVVYQHLHFKEEHDIDGFDIKMDHLDQWVMRVGGRLTKTLPVMKDARVVSFYGKLHLSHSFREKHSVHFKDAFQLGAFGSSLDAGVGFNVKVLPNLALHGDLTYQHKLTKAGFSGASFSGGVRYQF
ncbi:autotransporter family protein [Bartonella sp. B30(2025)]